MENDIVKKINEIYSEFVSKIANLINKRKELLKTYRKKLEDAKIKKIKDSISR